MRSDRAFKMTAPAGEGREFITASAERLEGSRTTVVYKGARVGATVSDVSVVQGGAALEMWIDPDAPDAPTRQDLKDPCSRKLAFDSQQGALDELARITVRSIMGERVRDRHIESGCYECPRCGKWHLSSKPWDGKIVNERRTS